MVRGVVEGVGAGKRKNRKANLKLHLLSVPSGSVRPRERKKNV